MGMFGVPVKGAPAGLALNEPKLSLPDASGEPLFLKSNFGIKTVLKPRSRVVDEDRLLITKFKPLPTTGKEKRQCQLNLAARNILQVCRVLEFPVHPAAFSAVLCPDTLLFCVLTPYLPAADFDASLENGLWRYLYTANLRKVLYREQQHRGLHPRAHRHPR